MSQSPNSENENRYCQAILEEYKALRAEVLAQFQNRNNVLTLGSATLGILFNVAASVGTDTTTKDGLGSLRLKASIVLLSITVPLISSMIIFLWGAYSSRVATIGLYLAKREEDINYFSSAKSNDSPKESTKPMNWEQNLRENRDSDELRQAMVVTVVFTAISFTSVAFASRIILNLISRQPGDEYYLNPYSPFIVLTGILSCSFLMAGYLIGDYRINRIDQCFQAFQEKDEKDTKPESSSFFLSSKKHLFFNLHWKAALYIFTKIYNLYHCRIPCDIQLEKSLRGAIKQSWKAADAALVNAELAAGGAKRYSLKCKRKHKLSVCFQVDGNNPEGDRDPNFNDFIKKRKFRVFIINHKDNFLFDDNNTCFSHKVLVEEKGSYLIEISSQKSLNYDVLYSKIRSPKNVEKTFDHWEYKITFNLKKK